MASLLLRSSSRLSSLHHGKFHVKLSSAQSCWTPIQSKPITSHLWFRNYRSAPNPENPYLESKPSSTSGSNSSSSSSSSQPSSSDSPPDPLLLAITNSVNAAHAAAAATASNSSQPSSATAPPSPTPPKPSEQLGTPPPPTPSSNSTNSPNTSYPPPKSQSSCSESSKTADDNKKSYGSLPTSSLTLPPSKFPLDSLRTNPNVENAIKLTQALLQQLQQYAKDPKLIRLHLTERGQQAWAAVLERLFHASKTLNVITGYAPIEAIKDVNTKLEADLATAQADVRSARARYRSATTERATTQKAVTTLLARKDAWTPADLERFTTLYRADHTLEGEVSSSAEALTEAETQEQQLSARLNQGILKRYHEEQIWSDRIRRASTWGTWGLMGVNVLLFLVLQFVAEPWKRARLVNGVVAEEKAVLEEVRMRLDEVVETLQTARSATPATDDISPSRTSPIIAASTYEPRLPLTDLLANFFSSLIPASVKPPLSRLVYDYIPLSARYVGHAVQTGATFAVEHTHHTLVRLRDVARSHTSPPTWATLAAAVDPLVWRRRWWDLWSEREAALTMRDATLLTVQSCLAGVVFTYYLCR